MTQKHLMIVAVMALVLTSCKGNQNKDTIDVLPVVEQDTVTHSMASCDYLDSLKAWNSQITFVIHREP